MFHILQEVGAHLDLSQTHKPYFIKDWPNDPKIPPNISKVPANTSNPRKSQESQQQNGQHCRDIEATNLYNLYNFFYIKKCELVDLHAQAPSREPNSELHTQQASALCEIYPKHKQYKSKMRDQAEKNEREQNMDKKEQILIPLYHVSTLSLPFFFHLLFISKNLRNNEKWSNPYIFIHMTLIFY